MPDFDSGHIFLTTMAPIKGPEGNTTHTSFEQKVRMALVKLPTALQSPATQNIGLNSPFARNTRTHLARMFVLNDTVYNGRVGSNPLLNMGQNLTRLQHVDQLNCSYLVFCADIDAVTEDGAPLPKVMSATKQKEVRAAYARKLWDTMELELQDIYSNCVGFEDVDTADEFAAYLEKCHVQTTMPFHDYYLELPKFNDLPIKLLVGAVAVPAVVALIALLLRILGYLDMPWLGWSTLWTFIGALIVTALALVWAIWYANQNGEKPLPPAKYDDLPSVLKALYMQQTFADFAIAQQGASAQDLHASFGAFLDAHKPSDKSGPTQKPGVISSVAIHQAID